MIWGICQRSDHSGVRGQWRPGPAELREDFRLVVTLLRWDAVGIPAPSRAASPACPWLLPCRHFGSLCCSYEGEKSLAHPSLNPRVFCPHQFCRGCSSQAGPLWVTVLSQGWGRRWEAELPRTWVFSQGPKPLFGHGEEAGNTEATASVKVRTAWASQKGWEMSEQNHSSSLFQHRNRPCSPVAFAPGLLLASTWQGEGWKEKESVVVEVGEDGETQMGRHAVRSPLSAHLSFPSEGGIASCHRGKASEALQG